MSGAKDQIESFISDWIVTGVPELANTQSFVNGLAALIGNLAFQCGAESRDDYLRGVAKQY
jgi:hypothetical protein